MSTRTNREILMAATVQIEQFDSSGCAIEPITLKASQFEKSIDLVLETLSTPEAIVDNLMDFIGYEAGYCVVAMEVDYSELAA